jgi:hypothetical protein
MSLDSYLSKYKSVVQGTTWISELIPGFAWWLNYAPPQFPAATSLITSGLGLALVLATYLVPIKAERQGASAATESGRARVAGSRGRSLIIGSVAVLLVYILLMNLTTVVPPGRSGHRFQIGFGRLDFSLTQDGRDWHKQNPEQTTVDWMMSKALFREGGPEVLWETWAIYLASGLLMLCFSSSFVLWVGGWSLIVRHLRKNLPTNPQ